MIPASISGNDLPKKLSHTPKAASGTQRNSTRSSAKPHQTPQSTSTPSTRLPRPSQINPRTRPLHVAGAGPRHPAGLFYPKGGFLATSWPSPKDRWIQVGIETEFYLCEREGQYKNDSLTNFAMTFAKNYNQTLPSHYPRMRKCMREPVYTGPYNEWSLVPESSLGSNCSPCKSKSWIEGFC